MTHHILITGSAGVIGRIACRALASRGHTVRGLDIAPTPDQPDHLVGSVADRTLVDRAMQGVDTVIHLAAALEWQDFLTEVIPANIAGVYHILESAKAHGVQRVVLASSIMAVNGLLRTKPTLHVSDGTWPTNPYAASKIFAEALGQNYARKANLAVMAVRIGWLPRTLKNAGEIERSKSFAAYLSHEDAGRFFIRAVEATSDRLAPGSFHAMFLTSRPPEGTPTVYDLTESRELLAFEPVDTFPGGMPFVL